MQDEQAVGNWSQREIVKEEYGIQENNLEHFRAPENVLDAVIDGMECPSPSFVPEEPKAQMQHPSTSKNSPMNFTISVVCISLFPFFF